MKTLDRPLVLAALAVLGLLAFSTNAAQAQPPVYGYAYSSPYDYGNIGIGTFYNAANYYPAP